MSSKRFTIRPSTSARWSNVWALGVVHGWLAIPMYFWIAGVDPWAMALG